MSRGRVPTRVSAPPSPWHHDTRTIVGRALDAGINFFDTAMAYSFGTSEEYVGAALRNAAPREDWVIATKYSPRPADAQDGVSGAEWIATCVDNSLCRLGVDTIDLYYMHSWDYYTPIEESMCHGDGGSDTLKQLNIISRF